MTSDRVEDWYEVIEGAELAQGDRLQACPVLLADSMVQPTESVDDIAVDIRFYDAVVISQTCDLVNDKDTIVVLCPEWDLTKAKKETLPIDDSLLKQNALAEVKKGRRPRYMLLNSCSHPEVQCGIRLVDLGRPFFLPKPLVSNLAQTGGKRLRLRPPYREHLAQSFARYYMRVALPIEVEIAL